MKFTATLLLVLWATTAAAEKDVRTPLEEFQAATQFEMMSCQIQFKTAQLAAQAGSSEEGDKFRSCINGAPKKTQPALKRALNAFGKKPAAVTAIKAYYSAWVASIRGITPGFDEVRLTYAARQSQNEQRLNELWATVEMETGL